MTDFDEVTTQICAAYKRMGLEAGYWPHAPTDLCGKAHPPESRDLDAEALAYAAKWNAQEDAGVFDVGCCNHPTRAATVFAIEAARCLCEGTAGNARALSLLRMAVAELDGGAGIRKILDDASARFRRDIEAREAFAGPQAVTSQQIVDAASAWTRFAGDIVPGAFAFGSEPALRATRKSDRRAWWPCPFCGELSAILEDPADPPDDRRIRVGCVKSKCEVKQFMVDVVDPSDEG